MSRSWRLYWDDIIAASQKILRYTQGMDRENFFADDRTQDAVLRNLEIIGEAAKQLPEEARRLAGDVEWKKLCRFRDILAHAYFGVDPDIVWNVVSEKVPDLLAVLEAINPDKD